MPRHELTDEQWERIEHHFPEPAVTGRPPSDPRTMLMRAVLDSPSNRIQGFLAAGHVCTITGMDSYRPIAEKYRVPIVITGFEPVAAACELLGLDPLYVANEGRLVAFVPASSADRVLEIMRYHPAAVGPCRIGTVTGAHTGMVELRGRFGGGRIVDLLSGEQMPRIC